MKKTFLRSFAVAAIMVVGSIAVNAKVLVPFGVLLNQPWEGKFFYALRNAEQQAPADWYVADFDDTVWGTVQGPISQAGNLSYLNTVWTENYSSYWVRTHFTIDELNDSKSYTFYAAHDDECVAYLNGVQIYNNGSVQNYSTNYLTGDARAALKKGDNVLAVYVSDSGGGGMFMDFGLYENDLNDIVTHSDVQVAIQNDAKYPWTSSGAEAYNTNNASVAYSTSWLTMQYSSTYRTELIFDWYEYNYSQHQPLELYIDGILVGSTNNSSWNTARFYVDAGDHIVAFRDSIGNYNYYRNASGVRNIKVKELLPLETVVLTENSQPLTFLNNDTYPWTIEDGYIQNGNYGFANTSSSFSTTFTIDKTSKLSYEVAISASSSENHRINIYVNGVQWEWWTAQRDFTYDVWALEPGTYTVEWKDTTKNSNTYYAQIRNIELSNNWVNVELATAGTLGYEVLYTPGVDVLTDVEFLKIKGPLNASDWTDIKNMTNLLALDLSEADITDLPNQVFDGKSLLSSVILPEGLKTIGEYAFRGTDIRKMHVPSTVNTIGQRAFESTPLAYLTFADNSQMNTIGVYAFNNCTSLQSVDFGDNSQLQTISERGFASCTQLKSVNFGSNSVLTTINRGAFFNCYSLQEVQLPNTVTEVWYGAFQSCTSLKSIVFSDAMTVIRDHVCYGCSALEEVHLPVALEGIYMRSFVGTTSLKEIDIPATVNEIRAQAFENSGIESIKLPITMQYLYRYAFNNCKSLKYVELPSYLERGAYLGYYDYTYSADGSEHYRDNYRHYGYRYNFQNCTALETVVMRSATPPVIDEDPFNGAQAKSAITLVVPSFSVVNYKLDTYWYQFGTIVEGDDVDYWKLTSPLMLTNNRRMQGKPDVDLYYGGQLTVGGNAPFPMGQFNMFVNESDPGRLLNTCENMTADAATTKFSVDANKWYFFTPLYDVAIADIDVSNGASYVFRYYDAQNRAANGTKNNASWKNVDTDKLLGGQGYIFHCNTACTITFPADAAGQAKLFGTTDVTRTLTVNEAESTANRSWNYIGNPYPCYYDIYYMDFTAPITVWNGSTYQAYSIADDEFVLRPMQSFFVQKPDAVDQIIFHKEGRQLTTSIAHGAAARAAQHSSRYLFNIGITFNNEFNELDELAEADVTRVVINDQASLSYEIERDAAKFMSFEAGVPQLFTLDQEGNSYAINERPLSTGQVALAYYADQEGYYTISALRSDGEVSLYDAEQDITIDLTTEDYTFHTEATDGVNNSRFMLVFSVKGNGGETTGISDNNRETINNNGSVFDLQGRKTIATKKGIYVKDGRKVVNK
ncbi:MAG: leucine-rich repeat domain-containing protein [Prevotella sp.]|nr:leucine-rich repeat domain-containing protein [Prevotella sp.]